MIFDSERLNKWNPTLSPFYNCQEYINSCFFDRRQPNWTYISESFELPNWFMAQNENKIDWKQITWKQNLNEQTIREFQDYLDWDIISYRYAITKRVNKQFLSNDFIRQLNNKINWKKFETYSKL